MMERADHPSFPHDPTFDQFFEPDRFLAYRQLGEQMGNDVCDFLFHRDAKAPQNTTWLANEWTLAVLSPAPEPLPLVAAAAAPVPDRDAQSGVSVQAKEALPASATVETSRYQMLNHEIEVLLHKLERYPDRPTAAVLREWAAEVRAMLGEIRSGLETKSITEVEADILFAAHRNLRAELHSLQPTKNLSKYISAIPSRRRWDSTAQNTELYLDRF